MKLKFNFLALLLILCILFSVSSVSASDDLAIDDALDAPESDMVISEAIGEGASKEVASVEESSNDVVLKDIDDGVLKEDSTYSFSDLADKINGQSERNLTIGGTYIYDESKDLEYKNGIAIKFDDLEGNFTINGVNLTIDGNNNARAFNISGAGYIVLNNITFKNCFSEDNGGTIYTTAENLYLNNTSFYNSTAKEGSAIYNDGGYLNISAGIYDSTLANNKGTIVGNFGMHNNTKLLNDEGFMNLSFGMDGVNGSIVNNKGVLSTGTSSAWVNNLTMVNNEGLITGYWSVYNCSFNNNKGNLNGRFNFYNASIINNEGIFDCDYFYMGYNSDNNITNNFTNIRGNISFKYSVFYNTSLINEGGNLKNGGFYNYTNADGSTYISSSSGYMTCSNITNKNGNMYIYSSIYDTNIKSENGNLTLCDLYVHKNSTGEYVYAFASYFERCNFTLKNGSVFHTGSISNSNLNTEDIDFKFGLNCSYTNGTGHLNIYCWSSSLSNCNFTNIGGSIDHFGSIYNSNFKNIGGNIRMGEVFFASNEQINRSYTYTTYFSGSNVTNDYGNFSYYGSFYNSNLTNNFGILDFPANPHIYQYYEYPNYTNIKYGSSYSYVYFSQSNFINNGGNVSSESFGFSESNLVNDHGNINVTAIDLYADTPDYKINSWTYPYFSSSNFTNLGGNFTSVSGSFYNFTLNNDGGNFIVTDFTHAFVNGSEFEPTLHKGYFYNSRVNNTGNISLDLYSLYYSNITNDGSFICNSTMTYNDRFTNNGNSEINCVDYIEYTTLYNYNVMYNNSFVNYGDFSLNGNSTYGYYSTYNNQTYVYSGYSYINNYGNFSIDGEDSHPEFMNYTIYNYGKLSMENLNTTPSDYVHNYGEVNILGEALINGTQFYGNTDGRGTINLEGENSFVNGYANNNNFMNKGKTTMESLSIDTCGIDNYAELNMNGTSFGYGDLISHKGSLDISNSNIQRSNLTVYDGSFDSSNNNFVALIKNNATMKSVNDIFSIPAGYYNTVDYNRTYNNGTLTFDNAKFYSTHIENTGGDLNVSNSLLSFATLNNFNGGNVDMEGNNLSTASVNNNKGTLNSLNDTLNYASVSNVKGSDMNICNANSLGSDFLNTGSLTVEDSSLDSSRINNTNRGNLTLEGSNNVTNSNFTGGNVINNGKLNAAGLNIEGSDVEGTGVRNYGEMTLASSSISNDNITNEGNLALSDSSLDNVDVINRGTVSADGGSASNVNVYNDGGEISDSGCGISSNVKDVNTIVADDLTTDYGSGVYFGANLTDAYGNTLANEYVTFVIDGSENSFKTNSEGYAYAFKQLAAGKHTVVVINPSTMQNKTYAVTINKLSSKVTMNNIVENYGARKYLSITIVDANGNGISGVKFAVKFNKKTFYVTSNSNGIAKYRIPVLNLGKYAVVATASSPKYAISTAKSTIKVNKAKTTIKAPKISVKAKKSKYFKITIKSKVTKKVVKNIRIKVKVYTGKKYKVFKLKTNSKGVAKFNTKKLKKGRHKVVISSLNKNYIISKKSLIRIK